MSTRKAYGMALAKLGRYNERVVALDGDTKNLTYAEIFKNEHPNRYVECYIAQQNMVRGRGGLEPSDPPSSAQLSSARLCSALLWGFTGWMHGWLCVMPVCHTQTVMRFEARNSGE